MAVVHEQSVGFSDNTTGTTIVKAFTTNVKANSLLIAMVSREAVSAGNDWKSGSVADSLGNSYTPLVMDSWDSSNNQNFQFYYCINTHGAGANTVTATLPATHLFRYMVIAEFSGIQVNPDPADVHNEFATAQAQASSGNNLAVAPSITPTVDGDLLIGWIMQSNGTGTVTKDTNAAWTWPIGSATGSLSFEYQVQTPAAAIQSRWGFTGTGNSFTSGSVSFKAAPALDPPATRPLLIGLHQPTWRSGPPIFPPYQGTLPSPPVAQFVNPAGLGSAAAFGAVTITSNINVAITGLGSAAAFSAAVASTPLTPDPPIPQPMLMLLSRHYRGIGYAVDLIAPTVAQTVGVTGLGSAASFGAVQVNQAFNVTGRGSAAAFGAVTILTGNVNVAVAGLGSAAAFGTLKVNIAFSVTGLGSAASFGSVTVLKGNVNVAVTGLGSAAAFGGIQGNITVPVTGKGSAAAFGVPSVSTTGGAQTVNVTGLGSAASFGTVTIIAGNISVAVTGKGSAAAFGALAQVSQIEHLVGLGSAGAFGTVTILTGGVTVAVTGKGSAAQFGNPTVTTPGGVTSLDPAARGRYF